MIPVRKWATPLTIGAFFLMAATGILMFFHIDRGIISGAHEWLSSPPFSHGVHARVGNS